jgi:uncharacterized protein
METVLITGGTGLIGTALSKALVQKGYEVVILTRKPRAETEAGISYARWDMQKETIDVTAFSKSDYLVHLAGANVAEGRWTEKRKREILSSRVASGKLLVKSLTNYTNTLKAVISSSAIGWYGPDPQVPNPKPFVETDRANGDFLGRTCQLWEESMAPIKALGKRLVYLRTGIVLSNDGGAYKEFKKPLRAGVAGILGSGSQVVSWIHIDDIVGMYMAAIENESWNGVFNAVAPQPVSNKELVLAMAKARGGFFVPAPVPAFALKIALGEMSIEVLKSTTVSSRKAVESGYDFRFADIASAVANLEGK